MKKYLLMMVALLPAFYCTTVRAQGDANYDEAKVPVFSLPDPLICNDGYRVNNIKEWEQKRRPELLQLFADQEYGRTPKEIGRAHV